MRVVEAVDIRVFQMAVTGVVAEAERAGVKQGLLEQTTWVGVAVEGMILLMLAAMAVQEL